MYQQSQPTYTTNSTHPSLLVPEISWTAKQNITLSNTFTTKYVNVISDIITTDIYNEYTFIYHVHTALEAAALRRAILSYVEVYAPYTLTIEHFTSHLLPDELVHRISLLPLDGNKFKTLRAEGKLPTRGELNNQLLDINHPQHNTARDIDLIIDICASNRFNTPLPANITDYVFYPGYFNSDHIDNSPFISNNIMPMRGEIMYKEVTIKEADCLYGTLTLRPGIGLYGLKYQSVSTCVALPLKPVASNDPLAISDGFYQFRIRLVGCLTLEEILTAALRAIEANEDNTHILFPL